MIIGGETIASRENEHSNSVEIFGPNGLCRYDNFLKECFHDLIKYNQLYTYCHNIHLFSKQTFRCSGLARASWKDIGCLRSLWCCDCLRRRGNLLETKCKLLAACRWCYHCLGGNPSNFPHSWSGIYLFQRQNVGLWWSNWR